MKLRRFLTIGLELIVLLFLTGAAWYYRTDLKNDVNLLVHQYLPCRTAITYSIGGFDERFGITKDEFEQVAMEAAATWNQAAGRTVLSDTPDGPLKINLVYDYRQEATDKLHEMGIAFSHDKAGYDSLNAKYLQAKAAYESKKSAHEAAATAIQVRQTALKQEVDSWNVKGGAPPDVYNRLNAEKNALDKDIAQLNADAEALNKTVVQLNAMVTALNMLADTMNLKAGEINGVAGGRGQEFEEGQYSNESGAENINIFEFENKTMLKRVLMHEFGHALGLEHTDSPADVMYRLNQGEAATLSAGDIAALKILCRLP